MGFNSAFKVLIHPEKCRKFYTVVGSIAVIQTRYLPNASLESYQLVALIIFVWLKWTRWQYIFLAIFSSSNHIRTRIEWFVASTLEHSKRILFIVLISYTGAHNIWIFDKYLKHTNTYKYLKVAYYKHRLPLWSSGQSFWLQIQRSRVRFPALPDFLSSNGSGTGSTQPREINWGATWIKK